MHGVNVRWGADPPAGGRHDLIYFRENYENKNFNPACGAGAFLRL